MIDYDDLIVTSQIMFEVCKLGLKRQFVSPYPALFCCITQYFKPRLNIVPTPHPLSPLTRLLWTISLKKKKLLRVINYRRKSLRLFLILNNGACRRLLVVNAFITRSQSGLGVDQGYSCLITPRSWCCKQTARPSWVCWLCHNTHKPGTSNCTGLHG